MEQKFEQLEKELKRLLLKYKTDTKSIDVDKIKGKDLKNRLADLERLLKEFSDVHEEFFLIHEKSAGNDKYVDARLYMSIAEVRIGSIQILLNRLDRRWNFLANRCAFCLALITATLGTILT